MKKIKLLAILLFLIAKSAFAQNQYVGEIKLFAGNFAPLGWLFCDGSLLPISENETLFQLIGTTYGGDGQSTFALPDLRGRVPIGRGTGTGLTTRTLGVNAGQNEVSLSAVNMPTHTHTAQLMVNSQRATVATPTATSSISTSGLVSGRGFRPNLAYNTDAPTITLQTVTTGNTGSSQPISIVKPYCTINYIISMFGIFPSPN
jgi:microcystin-dependent protein